MKMLIAAFVIFPAGWVAIPQTPPVPVGKAQIQVGDTVCARAMSRPDEGQDWKSAKLVSGIRDAATLDRLGEGPVVVVDAQLRGQRIAGHRASRICFEGGDLAKTDWRGALAEGSAFASSDLSGATMAGARLRGASFRDARLDGVKAARADLSEAVIEGGSFDGLELRGAIMRGFRLNCALLEYELTCEWPEQGGVDARGADLSRAALGVYMTRKWRFDRAVLDGTHVQFNQIDSFRRATLRGPVVLESSGYQRGPHVRLAPAEWRRLLASFWVDRPSFTCTRAQTAVEKIICQPENALANRDRRLDRLYHAVLDAGKTTRAEQRRWLAERDACAAAKDAADRTGCVIGAYQDRIDALMARGTGAPRLVRGQHRLFVSSEIVPPAAFQRTALYDRIFPVLLATASSTVYYRAVDRQRIEAGGKAWGGNGHMCSMEGPVFGFDPATGWFGAPHSADYGKYVAIETPFEGVLKIAGSDAVVGPPGKPWNMGEYVACGARANFDEVTEVRVPPAHRGVVVELERRLLSSDS